MAGPGPVPVLTSPTSLGNLGVPQGGGYQWVDNGNGGVNYFRNGQPITNTQFGQGTGQNYGNIENWVKSQYAAKQGNVLDASTQAGGGGNNTAATNAANASSYYTDLINQLTRQLTGAQGQESTGLNNIEQGYNKSLSDTNNQESSALSGLETNRVTNARDRETNIGNINTDAHSAFSSLMSLLGHAGAGVSSAASTTAPQAVARDASGKRAGANQTFNSNESSINTAVDKTKQDYQSALDDLLSQKNNAITNFESGLLGQEGQLEQQIGAAKINRSQAGGQSYAQAEAGAANETNAVNGIQDRLNQIFKQYSTPTFTPKAVQVTTPNMASFNVDPTTVKAQAANPTTDTSFLPYLQNIQKGNLLTGANTQPAPTAAAAAGTA